MDRIKVLYCAYREWALRAVDSLPYPLSVVSTPEALEKEYDTFAPDLIFLIGWSWKVPERIWNKTVTLCMHPSPLPLYRGGCPIQHQILNGEEESKVTFFRVDGGVDTGPIVLQKDYSLDGDIRDILSRVRRLIIPMVYDLIQKFPDYEYKSQDGVATFFPRRRSDQSQLVELPNRSAKDVYNFIRALGDPYPNAFIKCRDGNVYLKGASLGTQSTDTGK